MTHPSPKFAHTALGIHPIAWLRLSWRLSNHCIVMAKKLPEWVDTEVTPVRDTPIRRS